MEIEIDRLYRFLIMCGDVRLLSKGVLFQLQNLVHMNVKQCFLLVPFCSSSTHFHEESDTMPLDNDASIPAWRMVLHAAKANTCVLAGTVSV